MVCSSQSGDRGCSGCKVKAGDLQLMWCVVSAANTTSLCAAYWERHPSRVMSIYLCKIHCQVKIFRVCGDTCTWIIKAHSTLWPGNASVTAMTWDLLNAWKWSVHTPKSFWALLLSHHQCLFLQLDGNPGHSQNHSWTQSGSSEHHLQTSRHHHL